jgi:hypothetical protein
MYTMYLIRPLTTSGERILNEDIQLIASSVFMAKAKAMDIFPGAAEYKVIDKINAAEFKLMQN